MKFLQALVIFLICVLVLVSNFGFVFCGSAPNFTLTDIDGNTVTLADYRGKVVLLDFFATWCQPCIDDIPTLRTIKDQFPTQLVIISISIDPIGDTAAKLQSFRNSHNVTWTVVRDTDDTYVDYNITSVPTTYIVDQDGNVAYSHVGTIEISVLTDQIEPLVPEYSSSIMLLLLLGLVAVIVVIAKRRHLTSR